MPATDTMTETDWAALGRRLSQIQAAMIHDEQTELRDSKFLAEALRRLLDHPGSGFVTDEYCTRVLAANRYVDRANGEAAEAKLKHFTAEYERKMRDSAAEYAQAIRCRAERVESKYRREGALMAAGWLEGKE
jgi:hypothetical protein